jgi:hypothetical protein
MRTTARLAALVIAALTVAAPAVAATTYESGKYEGHTAQINKRTGKHRRFVLHADAVNSEVSGIKFYATGKCSDGGTSYGLQGKKPNRLFGDVDENGHFDITAHSSSGGTKVRVVGDLAGNKADGWLRVTSRFNSKTNESDPNGSIRCTTGKVHWSATKTG